MSRSAKLSPVKDYHVSASPDIATLVDKMGAGGGFMAKNLHAAAEIFAEMNEKDGCTKFLSFPAAVVATGFRGVLIDMVREGLVDVIVTASGTLDHDVARTLGDYYHGSFDMDDAELLRRGYHRLGNVLVPLRGYGPEVEAMVQPVIERIYDSGVKSPTTELICKEIGGELGSERSLLYWAKKKGVPVFVPGITDGAVGSQLWLFSEKHRDFGVDLLGDERRLSDITAESRYTGGVVLGGGISKHHLIWWNQFRGGLDYACYVTTATEQDGSLSGAQVREAVSWGKVKPRARQVTLTAEVTTVMPFVVSYVLARKRGRQSS